jgi:hypothetical protein
VMTVTGTFSSDTSCGHSESESSSAQSAMSVIELSREREARRSITACLFTIARATLKSPTTNLSHRRLRKYIEDTAVACSIFLL